MGFTTLRMEAGFGVGTSEGGEATYLCNQLAKVRNAEDGFAGTNLRSVNYDGKINYIVIPAGRARQVDGLPTESEQSISQSELGKLMRASRIAWGDAISDASTEAGGSRRY